MSNNSGQGRWDHLLREIPTQTSVEKKKTPVKKASPSPPVVEAPVTQQEDQIYKVSDINRAIKRQLEGEFTHIWVQGEISNFKAHTSGHHYFSLKDEKSQISAVMFKGYNSRLKFRPESGMEVLVRGKISVYEPRGSYQVFCEHMEPVGAGALQKAFEQLKQKLDREGLFAADKKRPIPNFPQKVGVVTSPTGAAIQDILNVLGRRSKRVEVTVIPARVQGEGAAQEIVEGIQLANKIDNYDVLIVGRGGGSIEDLWCFNEEIVARAIYQSKIPIISSVGHEIDFTIADFVADLRAPTPSAAAEVVAKSEQELVEKIKFYSKSLRLLIFQKLTDHRKQVQLFEKSLTDPRKYLQDSVLRLDDWTQRLIQSCYRQIEKRRMQVKLKHQALKKPDVVIEQKRQCIFSLQKVLTLTMNKKLTNLNSVFTKNISLLDSLSPLKVLDRGYGIVRSAKGELVPSIDQLKEGEVQVELRDGYLEAQVIKKIKKELS